MNGFFKAQHSVFLRIDGEKREISSVKELQAAVQNEKERILTDAALRNAFEEIDKQLVKSAELRNFRLCLQNNQIILAELANPEKLKQKLWVAFCQKIRSNQTTQLIRRFKEVFPTETGNIEVFEQVNLMTPENIHLNSFMFEPILDISPRHLKQLYEKLCAM